MRMREAVVVGSGVSGLTAAVVLQEAGWETRVVTRELPEATTSAVAAAVWQPYLAAPEEKVLAWSRRSLEVFGELARDPASGVVFRPSVLLTVEPEPAPGWVRLVPGHRRARPDELPADYGAGWVVRVPVVASPRYLPYLVARLERAGGRLERRPQGVSDLAELAAPGRLVVHCAGLGARELAADPAVQPIRGQVARVTDPGLDRCLVDDEGPRAVAYVIPRGEDCILGTSTEPGVESRQPDPATEADILRRCRELEPRLEGARVLEAKVGLRPGRPEVRVESEETPAGPLIHDYGHGGSGYTLSWGCAEEVLSLATAIRSRRETAGGPQAPGS